MEIRLYGESIFVTAIVFFLMLLTLGIGAIIFSAWQGVWRVLALLAPLSVIGMVLIIAVGIAIDPTSHNLWPFDIVMVSGVAAIYLVLLGLVKFVVTWEPRRIKTRRKSYSDDEMPFSKLMSKARGDIRSHRK
jgi:peptidoglycan/LPS O-acetylase OafA/YrhL